MKFILNSTYNSIKSALLESIANFEQFEAGFGTGKRNSVKKVPLASETVIIKSYKIPHLLNQFVYKYIRPSKAKRSYNYAEKLLKLGIQTPTPIAYLEKYGWFGLRQSYYISAYIAYDLTFRELILQPDYPDHEKLLLAFTHFTAELHEKGVNFLDHSPGNTLIKIDQGEIKFYLVDLNRMQFKPLSYEDRIKNFSRLTPKREMIAIMSKEYAKINGFDPADVFTKMWEYTQQFQEKFYRKKRLKKKYLGRK